ncbi:hypothetical protein GCM10027402_12590 [Arthrobacter monumenti]
MALSLVGAIQHAGIMANALISVSDYERAGENRRSLARQVQRGVLVRVRPGIYAPAREWQDLTWWDQYRLKVEAVAQGPASDPIFSRQSAASVWGIPFFGAKNHVHVQVGPSTHGRLSAGVQSHRDLELESPVQRKELWVTTRAQTVIELALSVPFPQAVAAADHVLNADSEELLESLSKNEIMAIAERLNSKTKFKRVSNVMRFADVRSGSPGESASRANMYLEGFVQPELQYRVEDEDGSLIGISDFYWEELRLLGEYDGLAKYSRNEFLQGNLPSDILNAEKVREDAMRMTGRGMVRWLWSDVWGAGPDAPPNLPAKLRAAGLATDKRKHLWSPGQERR